MEEEFMLSQNHQGRKLKLGSLITRPGSRRRHDQPAQEDQGTVIIDAPACKISPGLFAICCDGHPCGRQLIDHVIELAALNTDLCCWIMRVLRIWNIEIIRNATEG